MLTRGYVTHGYNAGTIKRTAVDGLVRVSRVNGVQHIWPITRPVAGYIRITNQALSVYPTMGGAIKLFPPRPDLEMDPTNPDTWQREYVF